MFRPDDVREMKGRWGYLLAVAVSYAVAASAVIAPLFIWYHATLVMGPCPFFVRPILVDAIRYAASGFYTRVMPVLFVAELGLLLVPMSILNRNFVRRVTMAVASFLTAVPLVLLTIGVSVAVTGLGWGGRDAYSLVDFFLYRRASLSVVGIMWGMWIVVLYRGFDRGIPWRVVWRWCGILFAVAVVETGTALFAYVTSVRQGAYVLPALSFIGIVLGIAVFMMPLSVAAFVVLCGGGRFFSAPGDREKQDSCC